MSNILLLFLKNHSDIYWVSCMYIGIAYCYLKWKLFLPTHSVYHISRWGQPASIIKSFTCTLCCQFDKSNIWVHIMKQQFRSLKAHLLAKYHTKLHKDTPVYFRDLLQTSLWPILFFYFSACPLETTIVQIICKWYQINLSISCNTLPDSFLIAFAVFEKMRRHDL